MKPPEPQPQFVAETIRKNSKLRPRLAIILGSGFHHFSSELDVEKAIPFTRLPGFTPTGVRGHAGQLLVARVSGTPLLVLDGRAHYYEGIGMSAVTFPVRVLAACGITDLLLTNAAGGINPRFRVGDFMILTDHINLMGTNPLRGGGEQKLQRFIDLSRTYDESLCRLLKQAAKCTRLKAQSGVYLAVCGPSYETPAEIRAFARLGADAVGMSTVPEAIVARQCGLRVAALSCITNRAARTNRTPLSHAEVLAAAARVKTSGAQLLKHFAEQYATFDT